MKIHITHFWWFLNTVQDHHMVGQQPFWDQKLFFYVLEIKIARDFFEEFFLTPRISSWVENPIWQSDIFFFWQKTLHAKICVLLCDAALDMRNLDSLCTTYFIHSFSLQTEYKYCYDLVLHYVLHYLHKDTDEQWSLRWYTTSFWEHKKCYFFPPSKTIFFLVLVILLKLFFFCIISDAQIVIADSGRFMRSIFALYPFYKMAKDDD